MGHKVSRSLIPASLRIGRAAHSAFWMVVSNDQFDFLNQEPSADVRRLRSGEKAGSSRLGGGDDHMKFFKLQFWAVSAAMALSLCVLASKPAAAATVVLGSGSLSNSATAVNGIVVGGTTYDVTFVPSFSQLTGTPFIGDPASGISAADQINGALNGVATSVFRGSDTKTAYYIPIANVSSTVARTAVSAYQASRVPPWLRSPQFSDTSKSAQSLAWADFSVAAVPIPAALPLLASAFAGLGLMGWRKSKAA